jgi:hypothetical protein
MAILKQDVSLRRFADMRNRVLRFDRITLDHLGDRRRSRRLMVDEKAARFVFEEGNTPAVRMVIGDAATRRKAGERERDVRRRGAVHSEKLAHVAGSL